MVFQIILFPDETFRQLRALAVEDKRMPRPTISRSPYFRWKGKIYEVRCELGPHHSDVACDSLKRRWLTRDWLPVENHSRE